MGRGWGAGACLCRPDRRMPEVGRRKLGMAVSRLLDGKSAFWGGAIGRNPTDRGKAGSKKSILVDGAGGPLSVVVAGANVHDTKLLRPTLESIVVERPEGAQTCAWTRGMIIPPTTGPSPTPDTSRRSGVLARRNWTNRARRPTRPGGGWWNAPWAGCPSAGRYWCATTRSHPITWVCSN